MTRLVLADDHPLFREALSAALVPLFHNVQIREADSLSSLLNVLEQNPQTDLVLLDLTMPGSAHFNGLMSVKERFPTLPVAVVSGSESVQVAAQVMSLGARGFIPKSTPTRQLAQAIVEILSNKTWVPPSMSGQLEKVDKELLTAIHRFRELTPKQIQVLEYLRTGLMNKQIAHEMNVTEATIKAHISAILRKLEINTRTQAVLLMDKLELG